MCRHQMKVITKHICQSKKEGVSNVCFMRKRPSVFKTFNRFYLSSIVSFAFSLIAKKDRICCVAVQMSLEFSQEFLL